MAFLTPCFVRVEDAAERQKLVEWAHRLGNDLCVDYGERVLSNFLSSILLNCNADVELFKALAAMNDENDLEQWFVVDDCFDKEFVCSKDEVDYDFMLSCYDYRKATAEEIVEYFKKR